MSSKLIPSNPEKVMVIRDLIPRTITTLSVPFQRLGRIKVGGRGTIVRMQNGSLAVFSPVALTDDVKQKVAEMGEVRYITALDIEHHIFLGPWHAAYPNAKILGPEGLPEKRKSQNNEDVPFATVFTTSNNHPSIDPEFEAEFDYEYVHSHKNKEIVFLHKPTKTMIQADLMFNLPATEQYSKTGVNPTTGIWTRLFAAFANTNPGVWQNRMIWYGTSAGDRLGFARSMARIEKWNFEKIIPCHGDVMETDAKGIFLRVMSWHFDLLKKEK